MTTWAQAERTEAEGTYLVWAIGLAQKERVREVVSPEEAARAWLRLEHGEGRRLQPPIGARFSVLVQRLPDGAVWEVGFAAGWTVEDCVAWERPGDVDGGC